MAAATSRSAEEDGALLVRGLVYVTVAMFLLPGQDAVAKLVSATEPVVVINFARFGLQVGFTLPLLLAAQGWRGLVPNRLWPNMVRGLLIAASSACFFVALQYLPLADALAIFFVEPLIVTILSALIDKEVVGWRRRAAVLVGFLGAMIVIRPSFGVFGWVSLLPLAGAFIFSFYIIMNRRLSSHDTPLTMQFVSGTTATLLMAGVILAGVVLDIPSLQPMALGWRELALLALMGALGTTGHLLLVHAAQSVPSSLIAPFAYLEIVGATVLGYALFGDFPDFWKWVGISIICGAGIYVFWRERQLARARPVERVV